MKKSLIAVVVLSIVGVVHAQSNITIYGSLDVNYVKQSGSSVTMSPAQSSSPSVNGDMSPHFESRNYIGVIGSEDLGGGLKATFQLERRFSSATGGAATYYDNLSAGDFEGAANVGLAGSFGHIRFGRVNELSTETYRVIDPFEQYGVGSMFTSWWRGDNREGRLSYTTRYDSPTFSGFKFGATYSVKNSPDAIRSWDYGSWYGLQSNGWALSGTYTNGPWYIVSNYNKPVNRDGGYNANIGAAYAFGTARLSIGYEKTRDGYDFTDARQKNWIVGLTYKAGNGVIKASYNKQKNFLESWGLDPNSTQEKYAIGYTHELSKRTSVYANYAHAKLQMDIISDAQLSGRSFNWNAAEIGITHKF